MTPREANADLLAEIAALRDRVASLTREVAELQDALTQASHRETATREILNMISSSPTDVQPVFDAMADSAARLCNSLDAHIFRRHGNLLHLVAHYGPIPIQPTLPLIRGTANGRAVLEGRTVHVVDMQVEPEEFPQGSENARLMGHRTILNVPLMREGIAIGTIGVRRAEAQLFSDRQVALLQTFADQAVIAIENVRLFKELEARNHDLTEALEQQTATSEILRVISTSPADAQPVFDAIVRSAVRLIPGSLSAAVSLLKGNMCDLSAITSTNPAGDAAIRRFFPIALDQIPFVREVVRNQRPDFISDVATDQRVSSELTAMAHERGWRSCLWVPMLHDGKSSGLISVTRQNPGSFAEEEITLLRTFADQAVIAIENVRLFTELQEKNRALTQAHAQVTESLEQQTATSEILRVISSSPTDVQPVFDTIADSALTLCDGLFSIVVRYDGQTVHLVALANVDREAGEAVRRQFPYRPSRASAGGRAILDCQVVYVPDIREDPEYQRRNVAEAAKYRSVVSVPMVRDVQPIGAITVCGAQTGAFSPKQIELLQTFANQAVIAIENVRLFSELQTRNHDLTEALDRQTATAEILRVISQSQTEVQPVFDAIARNAVTLCGGSGALVLRFDGEMLHLAGHHAMSPEGIERNQRAFPRRPTRDYPPGRAFLDRTVVHVPDLQAATEFSASTARQRGAGSQLSVPLLRDQEAIGVIGLARDAIGPFSPDQIEVLQTFADQAVIAIENVRLFKELEVANRELAAASQHKSEFLANMSHELRTPLNAIIGFSEVLSERMFGELNEKQEEYSKDIHASGQHLLSLINDILDLSKIEAGRMELELTDFHLPTALDNALTLVRERAGRRSIALHMNVDKRLGQIQADERKIRQVVLNLLSNAIKFTPEGGRIDVAAVPKDGFVEVSVSDTGVGIAPEDQERVFEEFRQVGTAEKKAEGTGLGLTLCRKFIELHEGKIWVKSQLGVGSTFTFTLPVGTGK